MLTFCSLFTAWIESKVLQPVETLVSQMQQNCKKKKWLGKLLCWFVVVIIKVIVWVVKKIIVPVIKVVCCFVSFVIGTLLLPFVVLSPKLTAWIKTRLICETKCTFVRRELVSGTTYRYYFECDCKGSQMPFDVTADGDVEAAEILREQLARQGC